MEQHLQLLSMGEPILKPVYDHATGKLVRPELVEPRDFVIVEGLLPLHTRLARACFDITVYLDPPEPLRHSWKVRRDCEKRGYSPEQVMAELARREPESAAYIRPQRRHADIVVRFAPVAGRLDPPGTPLSAELLLRPTIDHPELADVLDGGAGDSGTAMHLRLHRDTDGRPVDALHVHGYVSPEESQVVKKAIWERLGPRAAPVSPTPARSAASATPEPATPSPSPSCSCCTTCWTPTTAKQLERERTGGVWGVAPTSNTLERERTGGCGGSPPTSNTLERERTGGCVGSTAPRVRGEAPGLRTCAPGRALAATGRAPQRACGALSRSLTARARGSPGARGRPPRGTGRRGCARPGGR
ncbi:phosphoribulokinase [Actinomadura madurae]|uniref:phosphoribulokinase n=1 Tax=Actinomadura madurae TaxID=1993 RepID=UPI0020D20E7B|nr:phosphoribulokinase [Actinomadura madurae]MCQ0009880.1 phosphoribulokinase [Actinomadura madurae]